MGRYQGIAPAHDLVNMARRMGLMVGLVLVGAACLVAAQEDVTSVRPDVEVLDLGDAEEILPSPPSLLPSYNSFMMELMEVKVKPPGRRRSMTTGRRMADPPRRKLSTKELAKQIMNKAAGGKH